jgi:hypothetical protein
MCIVCAKHVFCLCCYITDSAMAASQNGFFSCKLSIHKKTNIMQIMTKHITICNYLIFNHREIVILYHLMTLFLIYANTVLWCSRCKILRFVAAPFCFPSLGVQHCLLSAARIAAHPSARQEALQNRDTQAVHLLHIILRQRSQQCLVPLVLYVYIC